MKRVLLLVETPSASTLAHAHSAYTALPYFQTSFTPLAFTGRTGLITRKHREFTHKKDPSREMFLKSRQMRADLSCGGTRLKAFSRQINPSSRT